MSQFKSIINHPVHILDENASFSPSAFIPFCAFGEDMEAVGSYTKGFNVPVCNSFKSKQYKEQICYEIDLEQYKDKKVISKQLKYGLVMMIDYNEERQMLEEGNKKEYTNIFAPPEEKSLDIHLETIGIKIQSCHKLNRSQIWKSRPFLGLEKLQKLAKCISI